VDTVNKYKIRSINAKFKKRKNDFYSICSTYVCFVFIFFIFFSSFCRVFCSMKRGRGGGGRRGGRVDNGQ